MAVVYVCTLLFDRTMLCTSARVFDFCWILFVYVKGKFPDVSDDLVNSYHLLLACCDLMFANAVLADRRDILNADFPGKRNCTSLLC
jgi:retinoblastoma-like protein 1